MFCLDRDPKFGKSGEGFIVARQCATESRYDELSSNPEKIKLAC